MGQGSLPQISEIDRMQSYPGYTEEETFMPDAEMIILIVSVHRKTAYPLQKGGIGGIISVSSQYISFGSS